VLSANEADATISRDFPSGPGISAGAVQGKRILKQALIVMGLHDPKYTNNHKGAAVTRSLPGKHPGAAPDEKFGIRTFNNTGTKPIWLFIA